MRKSSNSSPSKGNSTSGWNYMADNLRSVTMSATSFLMARYCSEKHGFNFGIDDDGAAGKKVKATEETKNQATEETKEQGGNLFSQGINSMRELITSLPRVDEKKSDDENSNQQKQGCQGGEISAAGDRKNKTLEKAFTEKVAEKMNDVFLGELEVKTEWHLWEGPCHAGKIDIVVATPHAGADEDTVRDPVLIAEVGLMSKGSTESVTQAGVRAFLEKMDQGQKYLKTMLREDLNSSTTSQNMGILKFTNPILLAVLILDATSDDMFLGLFCCEKRSGGKNFRMSLMYTIQTESKQEADSVLESLVDDIQEFRNLRSGVCPFDEWVYLGPNCAYVQKGSEQSVYRSYDNRIRLTPRSPDYYKTQLKLKPVLLACFPITKYRDYGDDLDKTRDDMTPFQLIPFGVVKQNDTDFSKNDSRPGDTLFQHGGQLVVIKTEFIDGLHYPTTLQQFLDVVEWVQKELHGKNIVHGDFRLLNLVFNSTNNSQPIDFDFSGPTGQACYPKNYNPSLTDGGQRKIDADYTAITKEEDMVALMSLCRHFIFGEADLNTEIRNLLRVKMTGETANECLNLLIKANTTCSIISVDVDYVLKQELKANTKAEDMTVRKGTDKAGTKKGDAVSP